MNKIISINLKGFIFQVEEEAFERLKQYLETLNRHFANEESRLEIIDDIESRIAEMMQEKLQSQAAITTSDVEEIIATMGSPDDFGIDADEEGEPKAKATDETGGHRIPRRFYRDTDNGVLGGVCAGASHYFDVDPLWIRLGFLFLFFAFGTGIIFYIILWIIIPSAKTPTEKLEMKGEKITIDSIEKKVKEEYERVKSTLKNDWRKKKDPVANAAHKGAGFLREVIIGFARFISKTVGIVFLFLSTIMFVVLVGVIMHLAINGTLPLFSLAFETTVEFWLAISALGLLLVLLIIGFTRVAIALFNPSRRFMNKQLSYTTGGLGVLAVVVLVVLGARMGYAFSHHQSVKQNVKIAEADTLHISSFNPVYTAIFGQYDATHNYSYRSWGFRSFTSGFNYIKTSSNAIRNDSLWCIARFEVLKSTGKETELEIVRSSYGSDEYMAQAYAANIPMGYALNDSQLTFNTHFYVGENTPYRDQEILYRLWVPEGKVVKFDQGLTEIMESSLKYKVTDPDHYGMTWTMGANGLQCLDCKSLDPNDPNRGTRISYPFDNFNSVDISAPVKVIITRSDTYSVVVDGPDDMRDKLEVKVSGNELKISADREWLDFFESRINDDITVVINMPELENLEASGAVKVELNDIKGRTLSVDISGASKLKGRVDVTVLEIGLSGSSTATLKGTSQKVKADCSGASHLKAGELSAESYVVSLSGACHAEVSATTSITGDASGASEVTYTGNPRVSVKTSGASEVKARH